MYKNFSNNFNYIIYIVFAINVLKMYRSFTKRYRDINHVNLSVLYCVFTYRYSAFEWRLVARAL